jgi:hypothetical protein
MLITITSVINGAYQPLCPDLGNHSFVKCLVAPFSYAKCVADERGVNSVPISIYFVTLSAY